MSIIKGGHSEGWERSDFPILCETCLGPNPYVRMMKAEFDKECKICTRPFTVFRWKPGSDARYKKTEICQTCSKVKNVCQTCLLDLEFGLPTQVRDTVTDSGAYIPQSDINREWFLEQTERALASGQLQIGMNRSQMDMRQQNQLARVARPAPYYPRNKAHVCSFFQKGTCTRGDSCPYRHEKTEENELSHQNIKDRYYGVNDPVAKKILSRVGQGALTPPEDTEIKTLWVGGVIDKLVTEEDLREAFSPHGEIKEIRMVPQSSCAFVTYTTREAAEQAADKLYMNLMIKDTVLKLAWGKSQSDKPKRQQQQMAQSTPAQTLPPNPSVVKPYYGSMDPSQFGAKRDR